MLNFVFPIDPIACTEVQAGDSFLFFLVKISMYHFMASGKNNYLVNRNVKLNICKCSDVLM